MGWQHIALAALVSILAASLGPNGGAWLYPGRRLSDPFANVLSGRFLLQYLPIVFATMVADEAYEEGAGAVTAYGSAFAMATLVTPFLDPALATLLGLGFVPPGHFSSFLFLTLFLQGGLCLAVYAYWRTTQRSLRRMQAAEADRVRDRQRLLAARLLTLQARVEPQFLFDALSEVGAMHLQAPAAADSLLGDLIALLRAMLPSGSADTSTVERELALVHAWVRVHRHLGHHVELDIECAPATAAGMLAPMLLLPLLQALLAAPGAKAMRWRLWAELAASDGAIRVPRLRLGFTAVDEGRASRAPLGISPDEIGRLRERVSELYGTGGALDTAPGQPGGSVVSLDLPWASEEPK